MIREAVAIMEAIYAQSAKFKRGNPTCRLYYVTTGKWQEDPQLVARLQQANADLMALNLFRDVEFTPIGLDGIQKLYSQTKNAIAKDFQFADRIVLPELLGVTEAYVGYISAPQFVSIIADEDDEIIKSIFYDNVRDWQDYNEVNAEIRMTLESGDRSRFLLMNNGVTIIARTLQATGNRFHIEDFQIVNGCQTSHVLFDQREHLDETINVPLRLIGTADESVIESIIRATNRQTVVSQEQFYAVTDFAKQLEAYFQAFPNGQKLFYERRSRQYDRFPIEKTRIVTPRNMVRAFAAMFLNEPHRTTRNYAALSARVGRDIFVEGQRLEPYYTAAFALYKLEYLFRSQKLEAKYKPARFHMLLAAGLLAAGAALPRLNSHEMARYCDPLMEILWDASKADELFAAAAAAIDNVAKGNFDRDNIRTQPFTEAVIARCEVIKGLPA
jgi:hypothetical protein